MKNYRIKTMMVLAICLTAAGCETTNRSLRLNDVIPQENSIASPLPEFHNQNNAKFRSDQPSGSSNTPQDETTMGSFSYTVDGELFSTILHNGAEASDLCNLLLDRAEEGHHVCVGLDTENDTLAKNKIIEFSSSSKVEVSYWISNMIRRGYVVTVDYDKTTGIYNCTAYRKITS